MKNDVKFISDDFTIYSDDVLYNKNKQTAESNNDSTFISEGTFIKSEGFNILNKGSIIRFYGKSKVTLTKWLINFF